MTKDFAESSGSVVENPPSEPSTSPEPTPPPPTIGEGFSVTAPPDLTNIIVGDWAGSPNYICSLCNVYADLDVAKVQDHIDVHHLGIEVTPS